MGLFKIPNIQNGVKKYQSGEPIETTLYSDQSGVQASQWIIPSDSVEGFGIIFRVF